MWIDEVWSLREASNPWPVLLRPGGYSDIHAPLYYVCLKPIAELHISTFAARDAILRLPSVLFSTLTVLTLGLCGAALFDARTGLWAGLYFAGSAFAVWYAQEVRMYALAMLLVTLLVWTATEVARNPGKRRAWASLVLLCAGAALTHWYALAIWPLLLTHIIGCRPTRRVALGCVAALLAGALPVAVYLLPKLVNGRGGEMAGECDLRHLLHTVWSFWTADAIGPSVIALHASNPQAVARAFLPSVFTAATLAAVVSLVGIWVLARRAPRRGCSLSLGWLLVGCLAPFAVALLTGRTHNARYSFAAFPAAVLLLAAATRYAARSWQKAAICGGFLAMQAWSLTNYFFDPYYWREDFRALATYVTRHIPENAVLLSASAAADALRVYGTSHRDWEEYPHWAPSSPALEERVAARAVCGLEIWHVCGDRWRELEQPVTDFLAAHYELLHEANWPGLELRIYTPPRGPVVAQP
jgi:4-amino-4-deoxy-L-arabinose transferase-like glycosyltransferase